MNRPLRTIAVAIQLAVVALTALAEIPAGYYNSLNGKTGAELKTAVKEIVSNHTWLSYSGLPSSFQKTDIRPGTNQWWDMYSNDVHYAPSFIGLNREHSFPKSWWGGGQDVGAHVDINHLYPSEAAANQAKSNYPLGKVANPTKFKNDVIKVGTPSGASGGSSIVFEPADEYKGDFARTYFYMVTCYQDLTWSSKYMWMLQQNTYPTLAPWAQELLLGWAKQDQVSQKELDRNEAVYKLQNNRNPFIDFPQLADYIWGSKKGEKFYVSTGTDNVGPTLITPTQGMVLDFGEVALGKSGKAQLHFRGENLVGSLELIISRGDNKMFTLSDEVINTDYVNSANGYWTTITYTPSALGQHSSKLFVFDGGISGSLGIELTGTCLPAPTLTRLTALAATNVTATSYTANWEASPDTVDYYVVTRNRYENGTSMTEEIETEDNHLNIDDMESAESYTVQSVRLGYRSEPSNLIMVEPAGVEGITSDLLPFGTVNTPGGVMFTCGATVYGVAVYDLAGRKVMTLPAVNDGDFVALPYCSYIITAPGQRTPFRILVAD